MLEDDDEYKFHPLPLFEANGGLYPASKYNLLDDALVRVTFRIEREEIDTNTDEITFAVQEMILMNV